MEEIKEKKVSKRMSQGEMEKKKKRIIKTFIAVIAIVVIAVIALIVNEYIILDNNKKTNLVINNKNVTSNLKKDILIEDRCYLFIKTRHC